MKLILSLSISGSILFFLLFLMKPIIKHKFSKSLQYYIWIVVLLRLTIPFSFDGSIMNDVFNKNPFLTGPILQGGEAAKSGMEIDPTHAISLPQANDAQAAESIRADNSEIFVITIIKQYAIYVWLIGTILSLFIKLRGYTRFLKYMKTTSKPAYDWENRMLGMMLNGRYKAKLVRNSYITTPMLIGIIRPTIILPDNNFNEVQLKNILIHEITHLKRFDIVVKWFSMLVTSLHWFNPVVYFVEKEINRLCELSCDEVVIRKFTSSEKQEYGETLIAVASNEQYPVGGLQATFSDEKTILRERLVAIMRPSKRSTFIILSSFVLAAVVIISAIALGTSVGASNSNVSSSISPVEPPAIVISHERNPDPIENYTILKSSWNGVKYDRMSFYQAAWHSEPTLLTGLRRLKPGEKLKVDFGENTPDKVTVKMAFLTESFEQSLLPIEEVAVNHVNGKYAFINPPTVISDIPTTGRVYSITATWGQNSCEYVFASDGKFDYELFPE
ncbi:M56 family metallopeptidase [Paenibacillus sp. TAF43_2]|uniref:M56 family metallopeptidase n=1 Tax=Paenibacillus sp. TAF43_2 TaxID=3233069 RepID=UPI003F9E00C0